MRRVPLWFVLLICVLASAVLRIYPLTVVQPFKHQDQGDLLRALSIIRIAPYAALAIAIGALGMVVSRWRGLLIPGKIGASIAVALLCGLAWAARVNVFEQMFHPAGAPRFVAVDRAKLEPDDMLVTVAMKGEAHAYPIREMGYHHVVNDYVGGTPIVATY